MGAWSWSDWLLLLAAFFFIMAILDELDKSRNERRGKKK